MDPYGPLLLLCLGVLAVSTLVFAVRSLGSALHSRHVERRQVVGPDGTWTTRILWTHRKASLGVASAVFGWKPKKKEEKEKTEAGSSWWDAFDLFDELVLVVMAAIAAVGLIFVALIVVLLAVELALFVMLFLLFGAGRTLFRHPWTIEVVSPGGAIHEVEVRGLSETRETQLRIRREIEAGVLSLVPASQSTT